MYPSQSFVTCLDYLSAFIILLLPFLVVANLLFNARSTSETGLAIAAVLHNSLGKQRCHI